MMSGRKIYLLEIIMKEDRIQKIKKNRIQKKMLIMSREEIQIMIATKNMNLSISTFFMFKQFFMFIIFARHMRIKDFHHFRDKFWYF